MSYTPSYRNREAGEDSFGVRMLQARYRGHDATWRRECQHGGGIMFHSYRCALEDAFGEGAEQFTFAPEAQSASVAGENDWQAVMEPREHESPPLVAAVADSSGFGQKVDDPAVSHRPIRAGAYWYIRMTDRETGEDAGIV